MEEKTEISDLFLERFGKSRDEFFPALKIASETASQHSKLCYLDNAGTPLVCQTLLQDVFQELSQLAMGNPHSAPAGQQKPRCSPSSTSHVLVEETRKQILDYLHCNSEEYQVVFTASATAAMKLVGECFPFADRGELWYCPHVHTSVLGLRTYLTSQHQPNQIEEINNQRRWRCFHDSTLYPTLAFDNQHFKDELPALLTGHTLLALPGECNFSGAKLNTIALQDILRRYNQSQEGSSNKLCWLLDAAKLAGSDAIDISAWPEEIRPDFITLSFYKIFGYPTGIGALVVKKTMLPMLQKQYFGGGTLLAGAAETSFQVPKSNLSSEYYEDGTLNFHGIAALRHGFRFIASLGGMSTISTFTFSVLQHALQHMRALVHTSTQKSLCTIYAPGNVDSIHFSKQLQGPVITFNLQYSNGYPVSFHEVQKLAQLNHIQLRTGCFCNLGACQAVLGLSSQANEDNYRLGRICSHDDDTVIPVDIINHKNTGACRISFSYATTIADIDAFLSFLRSQFLDQLPATPAIPLLLPPTIRDSTPSSKPMNQTKDKAQLSNEELFWHHEVYSFPFIRNVGIKPLNSTATTTPKTKIAALFVYPIKSCAGVRVDHWPVLYRPQQANNSPYTANTALTSTGLLYDRYFAIVDEHGKVISQKQHPAMALIQPSFHLHQDGDQHSSSQLLVLHLAAPMMDSILEIPLQASSTATDASSSSLEYRVCGRRTLGKKVSHDADAWITSFLHIASQAKNDTQTRPEKSFYLIRASLQEEKKDSSPEVGKQISTFANTAQYLLLSMASVRALIEMIKESNRDTSDGNDHGSDSGASFDPSMNIKVENFRPNIIVAQDEHDHNTAHAEDGWSRLDIRLQSSSSAAEAKLTLEVSGPCARCSMVNVNGQSGIMDCRVFDALKGYRKHESSVYFGQFLSYHSHEEILASPAEAAFFFLSVHSEVAVTPRS